MYIHTLVVIIIIIVILIINIMLLCLLLKEIRVSGPRRGSPGGIICFALTQRSNTMKNHHRIAFLSPGANGLSWGIVL